MGNTVQKAFSSDPYPESLEPPQFDPHYGFARKRRERLKVTKEDMIVAKVPPRLRDYCVDQYLELMRCHKINYPYVQRCITETHKHAKCEYHDVILTMKEYERERRLLIRQEDEQKRLEAVA
ncbi:NADH dehydrogenase (ubiquinone) B18 subunit [Xylocopa sonorina]|uniref:NADH dehydrogenase (ubiquinone) B18 subunit n=1 Tax=Xylocopa sonorina TaxID=1818115 RepID=UPI00403AC542